MQGGAGVSHTECDVHKTVILCNFKDVYVIWGGFLWVVRNLKFFAKI